MLAFSCARLAIIALEPYIKLKATRFVIAPIPFQRTFTEAIPTRQTTSAESAKAGRADSRSGVPAWRGEHPTTEAKPAIPRNATGSMSV